MRNIKLNKIAFSLLSACVVFASTSCEDVIEVFNQGEEYNKILFPYVVNDDAKTDEAKSFAYDEMDVLRDTVWVEVMTMGYTSDVDRPISVEQVQLDSVDVYNAVPNTHFIAFDNAAVSEQFVIKAGESSAKLPIIVLRDESLKEDVYAIRFKLVANEHFGIYYADNAAPVDSYYDVYVTNMLAKPSTWDSYSWMPYRYGDYGEQKHRFLIDISGEKWDDEYLATLSSNMTLMDMWWTYAKSELVKYNEANEVPLTEKDGTVVVFP